MYDADRIRSLSINPIAESELSGVASALNGLVADFGRPWVEAELYGFDPAEISGTTGTPIDTLLSKFTNFETLAFLWEDLEVLRGLAGFGELQRKLRQGRRAENVDLEVSVAADLFRLTANVELEPTIDDGGRADLRFKSHLDEDWTYVEVTRKHGGRPVELTASRGKRLAELVAARDPSRRQFIAVTRPMTHEFSDNDFKELVAWIPDSAPVSNFKDIAFVGSVPHNEDDSLLVLPHFPGPVSCISSGDMATGAFGVAYLRVPDLGAYNKIKDKQKQAKAGKESLLFIDLSATHATQTDWDERINGLKESRTFSAIITLRHRFGSIGFSRECKIIEPTEPCVALEEHTRGILRRFADMGLHRSLLQR